MDYTAIPTLATAPTHQDHTLVAVLMDIMLIIIIIPSAIVSIGISNDIIIIIPVFSGRQLHFIYFIQSFCSSKQHNS